MSTVSRTAQGAGAPPTAVENAAGTRALDSTLSMALMFVMAGVGFISHAFNMFQYPTYLGDEGIYLQQAWAVLREGRLSPYTYWYDHAPGGWIFIAWWMALLQQRFDLFGMAINSGRMFMLVLHVASVLLLFRIALRLSGSNRVAVLATAVFSLSPLALYYQRMLLLDNIMVFWLLLSLYLLLFDQERLWPIVGSAMAFALAVLSKENAAFFTPAFVYLLTARVRHTYRYRFALGGWLFTMGAIVSLYPLYAFLKSELFPSNLRALVDVTAPTERVSLLSTIAWQLQRGGGSVLDPESQFWHFFRVRWWAKDPIILAGGTLATVAGLVLGRLRRPEAPGLWAAGLLSLSFILYLIRGSAMLEFYVVPALPFLALALALVAVFLLDRLPRLVGAPLYTVGLLALAVVFTVRSHDHYLLDLTRVQAQQLAYVRENIPTDAVLITDDDLWVDLHDERMGHPVFPKAHAHWKAANDPDVRDRLLRNDWRNVDYLVMSDDMEQYLGDESSLPMQAYLNSEQVARWVAGDVEVQVRRVVKDRTAISE